MMVTSQDPRHGKSCDRLIRVWVSLDMSFSGQSFFITERGHFCDFVYDRTCLPELLWDFFLPFLLTSILMCLGLLMRTMTMKNRLGTEDGGHAK